MSLSAKSSISSSRYFRDSTIITPYPLCLPSLIGDIRESGPDARIVPRDDSDPFSSSLDLNKKPLCRAATFDSALQAGGGATKLPFTKNIGHIFGAPRPFRPPPTHFTLDEEDRRSEEWVRRLKEWVSSPSVTIEIHIREETTIEPSPISAQIPVPVISANSDQTTNTSIKPYRCPSPERDASAPHFSIPIYSCPKPSELQSLRSPSLTSISTHSGSVMDDKPGQTIRRWLSGLEAVEYRLLL